MLPRKCRHIDPQAAHAQAPSKSQQLLSYFDLFAPQLIVRVLYTRCLTAVYVSSQGIMRDCSLCMITFDSCVIW